MNSSEIILSSIGGTAILLLIFAYTSSRGRSWIDEELETLGSNPTGARRYGKVVICGGGIGGVLAARTALKHFEEVILVDPEFSKTLGGKPKSRVMQSRSTHAYLILFAQGLRRLWPSFDQKAEEAGQGVYDGDAGVYLDGTYIPSPLDGEPQSFAMRRVTLEPLLHHMLVHETPEAKEGLTIVDGTVNAFKPSSSKDRIASVVGTRANGGEFEFEDVDLVIDCTGQNQSGMKWLTDAGFQAPPRLTYSPFLHYTTVTFTVSDEIDSQLPIPEKHRTGSISFVPDPSIGHRALGLVKADNGTAQLIMGSWGSGDLPKTAENFLDGIASFEFSKPLPEWFVETLRLLVENGEPTFASTRMATCSWVKYPEVTQCPSNFIALGDAVMTLNPVYGQGCTKAMLGIFLLDKLLCKYSINDDTTQRLPRSFSKEFFRDLTSRTKGMWLLTKFEDYKHATTEPSAGETRADGKIFRLAGKIMNQAAETDMHVARLVARIRHMLVPESAVLNPNIILRIVWAHVRRAAKGAV